MPTNQSNTFELRQTKVGLVRDMAVIVVFQEGDSEAKMVTLQRGIDPQEDEPGPQGVYLELGMQAAAAFGAVKKCWLTRQECRLEITAAEVPSFNGITDIRIGFSLSEPQWDSLREEMKFIFKGCDCLEIR